MKKSMLSMLLLQLTVGVLTSSLAAAEAMSCGLPICDIPTRVEELRSASQSERAQAMRLPREASRFEENLAVLANLADYADAAHALFAELREEDWVLREAHYLADQSRTRLLKLRLPVLSELVHDFDRLKDVGRRFEVLNHWSQRTEDVESIEVARALGAFGEHAFQWATSTRQEDYFAREARGLAEKAGARLTRLWPIHEGVYRIRVKCPAAPATCDSRIKRIDQLVIFDSLGPQGVLVAFAHRQGALTNYLYFGGILRQGGAELLTGEAARWAHPSQARISVDPATGAVKGVIRDISSLELLTFEGEPELRAVRFFEGPLLSEPLRESEISGAFPGTLGSIKGTLHVAKFEEGEWQGTFIAASGGLRRNFRRGSLDPARGLLHLVSPESGTTNVQAKLTVRFVRTASGRLEGAGTFLLTAGNPLQVKFTK